MSSEASTSQPAQNKPEYLQESVEAVLAKNNQVATSFQIKALEKNAARHWNQFYKNNANNFFKDRHWTSQEFFQQLLGDTPFAQNPEDLKVLLEVGCGTGSFVYPLLKEYSNFRFHCCDFAKLAIDEVKGHPQYDPRKVHAFVHDLTSMDPRLLDRLSEQEAESFEVPFGSTQGVDLVSCIFVLSAIPPEKQMDCVKGLAECLKPGGVLILRDYALHDAAQLRFHTRASNNYSDPALLSSTQAFYRRSDFTLSYFFTPEEMDALFLSNGMKGSSKVITRDMGNRKEGWTVERRFVQGVYTKL